MDARRFRTIMHVLHNTDKDELERAGVIRPGAVGGSDWTRFNRDLGTFVLKLNEPNLQALWALIEKKEQE